ncbi:uncharacterized protein [Apostichopus japonicus]|uniref:uncharacterized protein n=1 Tax=Stichopus japonicus TaxID=307972 RepID=UPI003AB79775
MAVSKKMNSDFDFREASWYSLYEFEEPFLDQSFDLRLTFDLPDVGTQDVLTRLDLKQNIKFLKQVEMLTTVSLRQRPPLDKDFLRTNQFLLIPETAVDDNEDRQIAIHLNPELLSVATS